MTQNSVVVATFSIVCVAFAYLLALTMGDPTATHTLFDTLIDMFKLGAGAVIAIISINRNDD